MSGHRVLLMAATTGTYNLFFTGRDDPRSCVIIGEDTKPVYFCFETSERNLMPNIRTMVSFFLDIIATLSYCYC